MIALAIVAGFVRNLTNTVERARHGQVSLFCIFADQFPHGFDMDADRAIITGVHLAAMMFVQQLVSLLKRGKNLALGHVIAPLKVYWVLGTMCVAQDWFGRS